MFKVVSEVVCNFNVISIFNEILMNLIVVFWENFLMVRKILGDIFGLI